MKKKRNINRGFTLGEFSLVIFVVAALGLFIYFAFLAPKKDGPKPVEKPHYECMTSASGLVPLKAVTTNPYNADIYANPQTLIRAGQAEFFKIYFVFDKQEEYYQIGTTPFSQQIQGWIKKNDGILWSHREALELKIKPDAQPIYIWENKAEIGDRDKVNYTQRTDILPATPYPVLQVDGHHYKIALTWQTKAWDKKGAAAGWTSPLQTPQDATVVCYITRNELGKRLETLLTTLKELQTKPYSDHPIIQLFKEDLGITFGQGLNLEDESIGFLKKVAGEAPKMPAVFQKHPEEIRGELQKVWQTFTRLRNFFEDNSNWDKGGGGWIPIDLIPGN
jgi:hypothetical protein